MTAKMRVLAFAASFALAACWNGGGSGSMAWPMYQNGITHNAVIESDFPAVTWTSKQEGKVNSGLAYDGQWLYSTNFAGELVSIDPATGKTRWTAKGDDVMMSTPIVADGMVFAGSGTNAILSDTNGRTLWGRKEGNHWFAFRSRDGKDVWSYPTIGEAMPSAAYTGGKLIFATGDNIATALDAKTGKVLWHTPIPGVATMGSAMVHNGVVFIVATQGKGDYRSPSRSRVLAIDVATGNVKWSAPYGNADCTPTIGGGMVFVEGAVDGPEGPREAIGTNDVAALDERTGALRWRFDGTPGFFTSVGSDERAVTGTFDDGVLYQSIPTMNLVVAFEASSGRVLWRQRTSGAVKMSPVIATDNLYVGDASGVLYRLNARTGEIRAALPFDRPFTPAPPLIVGQTLFVPNAEFLRALKLSAF